MTVRFATGAALLSIMCLTGCGSGDPSNVPVTGVLHVTRGGNGSILFPSTDLNLSFADSVTVAIHSSNDPVTRYTLYTFFGLDSLTMREVPTAVLVTFVDGLEWQTSSSTELPSSLVRMILHAGYDTSLVNAPGTGSQTVQYQLAPRTFERTSNGTFILEPQPEADGLFGSQDSPLRRSRWSTVTMVDTSNGEECLLDGFANFELSVGLDQRFYGYAGNLGLTTLPPESGGGPPAPPGSTGGGNGGSGPPAPPVIGGGGTGGTGGTGTGGGDGPPAPPIL